MKISFLASALIILFISCTSTARKSAQSNGILQGISGKFKGNCMPEPGMSPCEPKPTSLTLLISLPSEYYQEDKLLEKITTDESGSFQIQLKPGKYSMFLMDAETVVCPRLNCPAECYCMLFEIVAGATTQLNPNLDKATW